MRPRCHKCKGKLFGRFISIEVSVDEVEQRPEGQTQDHIIARSRLEAFFHTGCVSGNLIHPDEAFKRFLDEVLTTINEDDWNDA